MYSSLDISVLSHATEDQDKLLKYLFLYVEKFLVPKKVEFIKTEGHWKNPIVRINVSYKKNADALFADLVNKLSDIYGKDDFATYLNNNVDEKGSVFLRLDKQKLCSGEVNISEKDSVRFVFRRKGKFENSNNLE